jgi:hypothetical protein
MSKKKAGTSPPWSYPKPNLAQLFNRDEEGQEDRDKSTMVARSESTSDNMCHFWRNNHINDFWFFVTMIIYMIYDSYGFL